MLSFFPKRVDLREFDQIFSGADCHVGNLVMGDLGAGRKHLWCQQSWIQAVPLLRKLGLQEAAGGSARTQEQQQVAAREPGVISTAYVDTLSISRDRPEVLLKGRIRF